MNTKELAAKLTPEVMRRILALPNSKAEQERAASMILECCAKAMMHGDTLTRLDAYNLHQRITRWMWKRHDNFDWKDIH
jgi:hypothetical protein